MTFSHAFWAAWLSLCILCMKFLNLSVRSVHFGQCGLWILSMKFVPRPSYNQFAVSNHWTSVKRSHMIASKSGQYDLAVVVTTDHLQQSYQSIKCTSICCFNHRMVTLVAINAGWIFFSTLPQRMSKRKEQRSGCISAMLLMQKSKLRSVQIYEFGSCYMQQTQS